MKRRKNLRKNNGNQKSYFHGRLMTMQHLLTTMLIATTVSLSECSISISHDHQHYHHRRRRHCCSDSSSLSFQKRKTKHTTRLPPAQEQRLLLYVRGGTFSRTSNNNNDNDNDDDESSTLSPSSSSSSSFSIPSLSFFSRFPRRRLPLFPFPFKWIVATTKQRTETWVHYYQQEHPFRWSSSTKNENIKTKTKQKQTTKNQTKKLSRRKLRRLQRQQKRESIIPTNRGSSSNVNDSNNKDIEETTKTSFLFGMFSSNKTKPLSSSPPPPPPPPIKTTTTTTTTTSSFLEYSPLRMYLTCMTIVFVWISSGTIFYSICNQWPLAQSFFYAVDAGMSIGFCTDVYEIKLMSKAFTIVYILLGASVIGGALALFIQDAVEGLATPAITEYQLLLEKDAFETANVSRTGVLSYEEFRQLIRTVMMTAAETGTGTSGSSTTGSTLSNRNSNGHTKKDNNDSSSSSSSSSTTQHLLKNLATEEDILLLWNKFDRLKDGVIHFEEFTGTFRGVERLVKSLKEQQQSRIVNPLRRMVYGIRSFLQHVWQLEHRIYFVFVLWVGMGILWGILDQGWDPITATHFAVSALATGGLTAPDVNADGILPTEPAIFCGVFCLFGIPLFALTLGHYARYLVSHHVAALEQSALTRPITRVEFDFAKRLTTPEDPLVHLSDFIVLQLLRQGKISMEAINVMKQNFDLLDKNQNGSLSFQELSSSSSSLAVATTVPPPSNPTNER